MAQTRVAGAARPASQEVFAPGARVVIRDEEWIVRHVKPATFGGVAVHVTGQSELVRNKNAIFLTELDEVKELKPEETELVHDASPRYRDARLYLESLLRQTPPTDDAIHTGHRAAIEPADYQLQPAAKALKQLRPRILLADGVGLGKTIEVGILLSELIRRGRGDRILVVALKSMLGQLQEELWARFTIPLVQLDSAGIQHIQSKIPSNMNPFHHIDKVIISIDTLKRDGKYRTYLEHSQWDAIVIDECQNVAMRTKSDHAASSMRARLARLLARQSDALILTSATPHDGTPKSFASLMNLLDPTAVVDEENFDRKDVEHLYLRRFKKDIRHEVEGALPERNVAKIDVDASEAENAVFELLHGMTFKTVDRGKSKGSGALFRTLLMKAFLSSPAACSATIAKRLEHKDIAETDAPDAAHDRDALTRLEALVDAIKPQKLAKYEALVDALREIDVAGEDPTRRVVIFSERIATLEYLEKYLPKALGLKPAAIQRFTGDLPDVEQKKLVKQFGTKGAPVRILLASDVASEGINLHYFCNHLIHFDLPWSLITLEQRNGRIDRFGQKHAPEIRYLVTVPGSEDVKGDVRVLERLIEREHYAHKNLGDVAWLMDLHDAEKEEARIARAIEMGEDPEAVLPSEPKAPDLLEALFGGGASTAEPKARTASPPRLYENDLSYVRDALEQVLGPDGSGVEWHDHLEGFAMTVPPDLKSRFAHLPKELLRDGTHVKLSADRALLMRSLEEAREREERWPEWQLLWELHPVVEWMNQRVLFSFDRHESPVLRVGKGLEPGERVFMFQGIISNRRSQPVIVNWFGVRRSAAGTKVITLDELKRAVDLGKAAANPAGAPPDELLARLLAERREVISMARDHMTERRAERMDAIGEPLRDGLRWIKKWRDARIALIDEQLDLDNVKSASIHAQRLKKGERRREHAEDVYQEHYRWIDEAMRTVKTPYLRLAAVLIPAKD